MRRPPADRHATTTETPLLEQPLAGPVYAVSGSGGLPHLAFILGGQVTWCPEAETKTVNGGRLQTTVPVVPDAPIGHFRLTLFGGKQGYLANTRNLCKRRPGVGVSFVGQNGRSWTQNLKIKTACGSGSRRRDRSATGARARLRPHACPAADRSPRTDPPEPIVHR